MRRRHPFRHIQRSTQKTLDIELFPGQRRFEQICRTQNADDLRQVVAAHDDPCIGTFRQTRANLLLRLIEVEQIDIVAVRHDRGNALFVQTQHIGDDRLLAFMKDPRLGTLLHQHVDLIVGHRRLVAAARADQAQDQPGRGGKQPDKRFTDFRQHTHRRRNQRSHLLRRKQTETLGHQLANDDREIGQSDDDECQRNPACIRRQQRPLQEPGRQRLSQRVFADGAAQDTDRGNAHLDRRQEARRFVTQRQGGFRARTAVIGKLLQAGLARRNDGDFGHGENTVDTDQAKQQEDIHGQIDRSDRPRGHFGTQSSTLAKRYEADAVIPEARQAHFI